MNNEETKLLDEDTRIINDTTDSTIKNEQPEVVINTDTPKSARKARSNNGKTVAAAAGGFVAGAAAGAAFTASASNSKEEAVAILEDSAQEEKPTEEKPAENAAKEKQTESPVKEEKTETPAPEQVILANDEGIRYAHVDADNFNDAFAQARAQVGAGGVFEYDGKLYGTYYADEWKDMSAQERADYQSRVNEVAPSHHSEPSHAASAHYTAQNFSDSPEVIPTNAEMISAEPVDNDIKFLGVEAVQNENGDIMNVALIENGGDQALLVDVDNNGVIDVIIHDDNYDGQFQPNEIHDISGAGLEVADLMECHAAQQGDMLFTAYDNDMPDYVNDADSIMNV